MPALNQTARATARNLLPPILWDGLRRVRSSIGGGERPQWEYVPEGWSRARTDPDVKGWDVAAVADRHRQLWPLWIRALAGNGTLGVDFWRPMRTASLDGGAVFTDSPWAHNAAISFGYVLALASREKDSLSVLDFGGGIGQFAPLARALVPDVELDYNVAETSVMCTLGRELNPGVTFYESADGEWEGRTYDLALASGALQCTEQWRANLEKLARVATDYLFLNRVPVLFHTETFVVLQRAEAYGFETEFLGWFINRDELLAAAGEAGLELQREFVMMDDTPATGAPEQATYRGFLFRPAGSRA